MASGRLRDRLDALDSAPEFAVARFDDAHPLTGRVAVLPSAFNPPTLAHLHLLERALCVAGVTGAAAMLSTKNVAKGVVGATLTQRVEMLLAARDEAPWMAVLAANAARLVDQAAALASAFPGVEADFVVGFDTLVRLFDPIYYEEMDAELEPFFAHHRVIAVNRGTTTIGDVDMFVSRSAARFRERVLSIEIAEHPASVSSTAAREAAASGRSPAEVPASVRSYIQSRDLYRDRRAPR